MWYAEVLYAATAATFKNQIFSCFWVGADATSLKYAVIILIIYSGSNYCQHFKCYFSDHPCAFLPLQKKESQIKNRIHSCLPKYRAGGCASSFPSSSDQMLDACWTCPSAWFDPHSLPHILSRSFQKSAWLGKNVV